MRDVVALVLAGGKIGNYGVLTLNRAKAALTYCGIYRVIDFPLTALRQAGINQIGLIIQYLPASLIEHVGVGQPWDLHLYGRILKIMPPFVGLEKTEWYKGTADAIYQNLNFIYDTSPKHVIVLSGEHVYGLDYRQAMASHMDSNADITFVTAELRPERCTRRFGYVFSDDRGRVRDFVEKPTSAPTHTISTGIYIFKTDVLLRLVYENASTEQHNLARDVLQEYAPQLNSYVFPMTGYWEYLEDAQEYYDSQFEFLKREEYDELWQLGLLTNLDFRGVGFAPAANFARGSVVEDSFISPGCTIEGHVQHSILSPGVVVQPGAVVSNSIIMHDCVIDQNAKLDRVIADRDAVFGAGCNVGAEPADSELKRRIFKNLTLVGKAARLGPDVVVPQGGQVRPRANLTDQHVTQTELAAAVAL